MVTEKKPSHGGKPVKGDAQTRTRKKGSLRSRSPLNAFGYRVGADGLPSDKRHKLLRDFVFDHEVSENLPDEYAAHWGEPGSPLRVGRIIAQLTMLKTVNKNKVEYAASVADWDEDIRYLERELKPLVEG